MYLPGARLHHTPGEGPELCTVSAGTGRRQRLLDAVPALAGDEAFDDAVLAGVVTDHCQPAARAQKRERSFKTAVEKIQFPVHGDAQRLEGPRGRMDAPAVGTPLRGCRGNHAGKVGGCHQATFRTRRQDRLRDAACTAFFTKRREDSGELSLRSTVDEVEGRYTTIFIESHVRRRVGREAKPACRVGELITGEPQIEEDSVEVDES